MAGWPVLITFASLAQGVANTMFGKVSATAGTPFAIGFYLTFSGLALLAIAAAAGHPFKAEAVFNSRVMPFFVGGVVTMATANYFLTRSMETAPIGMGFAIFNVSITVLSLVITVLFFNEKITLTQAGGIALAAVATFMMASKS